MYSRVNTVLLVGICIIHTETAFAVSESLSMTMSGEIETRCDIKLNAGNVVNITESKQHSLPFIVDCNQPFAMSVSSRSGGLKLTSDFGDNSTYYDLSILVSSVGINSTFNSKDLLTPQYINGSNNVPFISNGELRITLQDRLLFSGEYLDVITIDVSPSINDAF
ncbi:hypothetical protein [Enterovibrio coralii]|uniref:Spore coat protein U domain-containing protein n=1 Tax=Enterovibrio coralii TaxID=294935 RepID=A0A135I6N1_9GAMM|nr:hypothetical protein [Enterovibrio coralii]KXF81110.1 hypothetical protein ATN88_19330 [Enterovibrio coralii]